MKKYIKLLLIPTLFLGTGASRAMADDEALAAVGGFIGGIIATKVFDHHRDSHRHREVVIVESKRHSPPKRHDYRRQDHCDHRVSYKIVRTRQWIPGHWEVTRDHCGNRTRRWVSGHYESVRERVPVACACDHHHGHGHRGGFAQYGRR